MNEPSPIACLNPLDPQFQENPHAVYDALRAQAPVYRDTVLNRTILTEAQDIGDILNDREIFCDPRKSLPDSYLRLVFRVDENFKPSLLRMDDPDHKRVRATVVKVFNQPSVNALKGRIAAIATKLLDSLAGRSSFDLIEEFANPFPIAVIAEVLGVQDDNLADFMAWSKTQVHLFNPQTTEQQRADFLWGTESIRGYFKKVVEERRVQRGTDFVSSLITTEENGELTEEEIISTCELLLLAGNMTTTDLIGNGVLALLRHPEQMQKLREQPELIPGAIEEILRYNSPVTIVTRVSTDKTQVGGCPFHAGEGITLMLDAANHDPALHEDPHAFDIDRENKRHFAFGGGAHFCLGAPLARAEAEIAFALLLERFPTLTLDPEKPPVRKLVPSFSGVESLWLNA